MLDKTAVESMTDEEISKAINLLVSEASRRELEASRFRKASLAKSSKRDPRCPVCHAPLVKDGKRGDGIPVRVPELP